MAKGFTFEIRGLKQLQDKFKKMPAELKEEISGELETFAKAVVRDAKVDAPVGKTGGLQQGIGQVGSGLTYTLYSNMHYSPYQEFGTGKGYKADPEFANYARTFKRSGSKRNPNIKANPHFFKAFVKHRPSLLRNINAVLKRTLNG